MWQRCAAAALAERIERSKREREQARAARAAAKADAKAMQETTEEVAEAVASEGFGAPMIDESLVALAAELKVMEEALLTYLLTYLLT